MGLYSKICAWLPVRREKVVFCNFSGRGMGGSPKYIAEELLREHLPYDLVWLTDGKGHTFPSGIRQVPMFSPRGRYELSTAKVIVNNVKHKLPFVKRKGQYYIQTWHGDFALKFIEKEVEDKLDPAYVYESKEDSRDTDVILSASRQFTEIARAAFWFNGEIFESGQPCHDPYFQQSDAEEKVRARFRLGPETQLALYAPTFRDGNNDFKFPDFSRVIAELERISGKDWIILVRLHPNDQARAGRISYTEKILDASPYPDTQDLAKATSLLITDYSSIMYDYALQRKRVVLYAPDIAFYENTRGLRSIFHELPFPLAQEDVEIPEATKEAFSPKYHKELEVFLQERVHSFDDGRASERVAARIRSVIDGSFHGNRQH